jgi:superfamily II DNA or RNA helicase
MVVLRDYQISTVREVCRAAKQGDRRITFCLPVGTGKTEVIAELCRLARYPLVIAPLIDLMHQAKSRLEKRLDEPCDVEQGGMYAESIEGLRNRVIVASRSSLLSRRRYAARAYERVSLVMVDECHVGITPKMEEMLQWFEARGATVVGCSATPYKGKGKGLRYFPRPQVVYPLREAIDDAYLIPPKCFLSEATSFDLTMVDEVAGEWDKKQLAAVLTAEHCAQEVTSLVLSTYKGQPSVVYAHCVRQAKLLVEVFQRYGANVSVVHSKQDLVERKANMAAFVGGDSKIIVNVGILGYGWDFPHLRNIYMAAPTRSLSRYEQRIGRGTRPLPGVISSDMTKEQRQAAIAASDKTHFNVYDITGASSKHQLLSVFDVLDHQLRKSPARRERLAGTLSAEGVDPLEAIREADAFEQAELEAQASALMEKRKQLIVGVSFDQHTRDLFAEPEGQKRRGWRMMYGQYKGVRLDSIPAGYLSWVLQSQRKETPFKAAVRRELGRRNPEASKQEA